MRLALLAAGLATALLLPHLLSAAGVDPRKPIIYGIADKPFPAVLSLDYPFCRAQAWLAALERADSFLPASLDMRLRQQGLPVPLGRLALCALIGPPEVVTPEYVNSPVIRVFLKWPARPEEVAEKVVTDSGQMLLQMAVIWETGQTLVAMRNEWPDSVQAAGARLPLLESKAELLNLLWEGSQTGDPEIIRNSISGLLTRAEKLPEPALLDRALELLLGRETEDPANRSLWNRLASYCLYLRGQAHENLNQPGLARADFDAALARLKKAGELGSLAADIHLARGNLGRSGHDLAQMCRDFMEACALAKCQALAQARREGLCLPQ